MTKTTPIRLLLGIGLVVFLWNGWRGYDLVPDFLQSRSELLCQVCEGRAQEGTSTKPRYRRLTCEDYAEQEATLVDFFEWQGIEVSDDDSFSGLATMPSSGLRKRAVQFSYILDEDMTTERVVSAKCEVFFDDGNPVRSAKGAFAEYSIVNAEQEGKTP